MTFTPIAIVGRSCVLPGALSPEALWTAVSAGENLLSTVPEGRWRASAEDVLCRPEEDSANRSWSDQGGYVRGFDEIWNPDGFAVSAKDLAGIDPLFQWTLHCAREALRDAGDHRKGRVDRSRVCAVFGNLGFPSASMSAYAEAVWLKNKTKPDPRNRFMSGGAASLLQEALGLAKGVLCLDTACASSLYALSIACAKLHDGHADLALAGGVSCADDLFIHVGFTALNAMSRSGQSRPFHADADGLVPAEGAAFLTLKRLADARRDGDKIHGLIRGIGLSNDGRGRGFLAPDENGQTRALNRAYEVSGIRPQEVSLIECHATGTSVGDKTEIISTSESFGGCKDVPIGSLKSNLGHLITAAGAAGLIKVLEAMRHQKRPPSLHADVLNPALENSPFRVLAKEEPWPSDGPRIAGVSAFGFGGNNAHVIVSEDDEAINVGDVDTSPREALALVAVGAMVGAAKNRSELTRTLLAGESFLTKNEEGQLEARIESIDVDLLGLKFPPNDLKPALPQQLALLTAAREAASQIKNLESERAAVFVGMEPDPEVCRYGLRWRQAARLRDAGIDPTQEASWLSKTCNKIIATLTPAGVVGAMPNIPANRLNSQLDLGGASYSISSGEDSGLQSLALAARALGRKEIDTALVAAVDLSCQEVHQSALKQVESDAQIPGDAAVVLIFKRLADANRDQDDIIAVLEETKLSDESQGRLLPSLDHIMGRAWAAGHLRDLAACALCLSHDSHVDGRNIVDQGAKTVLVKANADTAFTVRAADQPRPALLVPRLYCFSGQDRAELLAAIASNTEGLQHHCRLVITASNQEQLEQRKRQAINHIENNVPLTPGIHFQEEALQGSLAFVFGGAGAAYENMGRELLQALPELKEALSAHSSEAIAVITKEWLADEQTPPLQRLWSSSALCQLHALLSQKMLGLKPDAVIGYSSGESNSLFATGTWTDMNEMVREADSSGLFTKELGGEFRVIQAAWNGISQWETWTVLAPVEEVQALVDEREKIFLSVIHTDQDCIVAGSPESCRDLVQTIGPQRCLRLHYDLTVHVPLVNKVRDQWLKLHHRKTSEKDSLRIYSAGLGSHYQPSDKNCAEAILSQANATLDFRKVINKAWEDGVRVFIEHGPQGNCSRWIREILKDRPALVIALDAKGKGLTPLIDAIAALLAAGITFEHEALTRKLMPKENSTRPNLSFPAHPPPIQGIPLPANSAQSMPRAPQLRAVTAGDKDLGTAVFPSATHSPEPIAARAPQGVAALPKTVPTATLPPTASTPQVSPNMAASSAIPASTHSFASVATPVDPRLEALRQQIVLLGHAEQQHIQTQSKLHQDFVALQQQSMQVLFNTRAQTALPRAPLPTVLAAPVASITKPQTSAAPVEVKAKATAPMPTVAKLDQAARSEPKVEQLTDSAPIPFGPTFDFEQLKVHSSKTISEIFGDEFKVQDDYHRQVRMPEPPLLLADRVTGLDASAGVMGKGTIWSESEVEADRWFMHQGHMPASIMIESGQADLMLISYMGVDFTNRGERVYRLLGCELTYYGGLPETGDTVKYDIHMDGHATQGDVRLMFFHSDCRIDGELRLAVRKGQAGFFTDAELADSEGCLWTPEEQEIVASPRLDAPHIQCQKQNFSRADVQAFADGQTWRCFGEGFEQSHTHTRTPRIQNGPMLLIGDVTNCNNRGGPWGRGYAKSTVEIRPDNWFFEGHFRNDPCMPGTLMFEGCLQLMSFYLAAQGYTVKRDGWRFEPVSDIPYQLSCRGQVTPTSKILTYELFVEEVYEGDEPTLYADILCTVDGLKAFHARRVGLKLMPAWPLDEGSSLLEGYVEPKPVAKAGNFSFDYRALVACANGRPSEAFGPIYERFDGPGRVARLPNPPYHFLSRVTKTKGVVGAMEDNMAVEVEYDIPSDAWYFDENGCRAMPFAVLLEAALQPCGWLASYMGCALTTDIELCFRNLDGKGTLLVDVLPSAGTLLTKVKSTGTSQTASMIIVSYEVECSIDGVAVYKLDTVFGFFPQEALENQVGLPTTDEQREILKPSATPIVDLTRRPEGYWQEGRPQLAEPMLLMIDRVTRFDPKGGKAGLGIACAEKDVNPAEWFFKAHFFQDPVQPGSLGIEAMIQLLQWTMLESGLDEGIDNPRFETLGLGEEMSWKYRGQVIPTNKVISSSLEITEITREENSVMVKAEASLWVDGKRIYEASTLAMRIVSGGTPDEPTRILDPNEDAWLKDHCPTWTAPALPMMSMIDLMAQGACTAEPITTLKDVRVTGWLGFLGPQELKTVRRGEKVHLLRIDETGKQCEVASATIITGAYEARPKPLPPLSGPTSESPYETGELFHGPAFQVLESLVRTADGASSVLSAASAVPMGRLNPGLLDGATHSIPHDNLQLWDDRFSADKVAYPALITEMKFFGATPKSGKIRCEVRPDGILGSIDYPAFAVQLIGDEGVWCSFQLIESCFPKGALGSANPLDRRSFLRDRQFVEGLRLSTKSGEQTTLATEVVEATDWLPGTVEAVYQDRNTDCIAQKEHIAAAHKIHPGILPEALPLHTFDLRVEKREGLATVSGDGYGVSDISPIRKFWSQWFDRGPWPVEDLYYGLIGRFLGRVVLTDPSAFESTRGKSLLYLGNHQVGVESLLFSIIASALSEVPTVTLAKAEHRSTWLGHLIAHCFTYPGVKDPKVIAFFDRDDKASLPTILEELAAEMKGPGRSVMVHVEGTRSLDCTTPVQKMSGAFLDMAMMVGAPVVPVRFVGALPRETMDKRIEFPIGLGRQDIYFGTPISPEELAKMHYGERKEYVINAINALGPSNDVETPYVGDPEFSARVQQWQANHGVSHEHAVLREVLAEAENPAEEVKRLLAAKSPESLNGGASGPWLTELARRLIGE